MIKEQAIQLFKALGYGIIEDDYCPPNAFYFVNQIMYERWKLNANIKTIDRKAN